MSNGIESESVSNVYGSNVFNEAIMHERLPKDVYKSLKRTIDEGAPLDPCIANVVASVMKDWAIEKGATHFCHWFQPMTGVTAEKHDAFISPTVDGRTILEFSGKELVKGEPDASSFPSGGLRATFEARGYTAWDCTSPVFVKENGANISLYIPSAFCSYTSEALDKKTPLLRSMDALNKQSMRVLRALGNTTSHRVAATLGPEQEYFLVDAEFAKDRLDLTLTGRTLFGAPSPKGQEMEDHYFGAIHERIGSYMRELNQELWMLGVAAKTQHNEVAPAQYELAPIFATVNVATDHNQLTMETMQKVAIRHGFVCLLHEKPFAGVNGSGKHNNWSAVTDDGINLLEPGSSPHDNEQFLIFLMAVIRAVDKNAKMLRASVATSGNDHRLGANEAPPAIVSIFLGDQLTDIFKQLEVGGATSSKAGGELKLGVSTLPKLHKDCTDRNRTSPFAFTGNKFEFRMAGSSQSTAGPNFVLNTIIADVLCEIADELEKASDVSVKAQEILQRFANEHKKIIFNGDNYTKEWEKEAEKRGLPNIRNSVDSLEAMIDPEVARLFETHGVLTNGELHARYEILLERYVKEINIEGLTAVHIAKRQIMPAAIEYSGMVANALNATKAAGVTSKAQAKQLSDVAALIDELQVGIVSLEEAVEKASDVDGVKKQAIAYRDLVIPAMSTLRAVVDQLETMVDASIWPLPTYAQMLFVR
ncbi:MAG: glutamine synthetase III [Armatimonadota bacterium]|nr:glutamine synthetase III [bacterium]